MTRPEFIATLGRLGLSQAAFARRVGVHEVTVRWWGKERDGEAVSVPLWAVELLRAWELLRENTC
jgi:DNA-binding transcriptional regulator YiaG